MSTESSGVTGGVKVTQDLYRVRILQGAQKRHNNLFTSYSASDRKSLSAEDRIEFNRQTPFYSDVIHFG